ncbi:4356_t:CDS:2 [Paraglomus brasilianum]|uniref:4356_t:CDS:1 n=1 Tax=Paraglomus brasilianum TaxID=144538 RepID=A0A9N9B132_9GLOM|nr:4356_t:CDS:2 [Paraglomus brasilianum]
MDDGRSGSAKGRPSLSHMDGDLFFVVACRLGLTHGDHTGRGVREMTLLSHMGGKPFTHKGITLQVTITKYLKFLKLLDREIIKIDRDDEEEPQVNALNNGL